MRVKILSGTLRGACRSRPTWRAGASAGMRSRRRATNDAGPTMPTASARPMHRRQLLAHAAILVLLAALPLSGVAGEDPAGAELRAWAKAQGAQADQVELLQGDDGLSLVAAADIAAETEVLAVPAALLFPTSVSEASPVAGMLQNSTIGRISAMCLYLIAERKLPGSFWQPWIRTLPGRFHHALSYSDEDMTHFQASPFKELRSRKRQNVEREYRETVVPLLAKLPPAPPAAAGTGAEGAGAAGGLTAADFTLAEYEWAYSVITTRAMFPGLLGERERTGDVPLVILGPLTDSLAHGDGLLKLSYSPETQVWSLTDVDDLESTDLRHR